MQILLTNKKSMKKIWILLFLFQINISYSMTFRQVARALTATSRVNLKMLRRYCSVPEKLVKNDEEKEDIKFPPEEIEKAKALIMRNYDGEVFEYYMRRAIGVPILIYSVSVGIAMLFDSAGDYPSFEMLLPLGGSYLGLSVFINNPYPDKPKLTEEELKRVAAFVRKKMAKNRAEYLKKIVSEENEN